MPPSKPAIGYQALRANRVSLPGHIYLVTTVTCQRHRWFDDFATARTAVRALNDSRASGGGELSAWVLMPDHLHVLLRKEEDLKGVARYVILNPQRAGLVRRVAEYSHWDAAWL